MLSGVERAIEEVAIDGVPIEPSAPAVPPTSGGCPPFTSPVLALLLRSMRWQLLESLLGVNKQLDRALRTLPPVVTYQRSFGEEGAALGQLSQPWGIAVLPSALAPSTVEYAYDVCVAERGNSRLQVLSAADGEGRVIVDGAEVAEGFDDLQGLCIDGTSVWVCDMGTHALTKRRLRDGKALLSTASASDAESDAGALDGIDDIAPDGARPKQGGVHYPRGVALADGRVYVACSNGVRVLDAQTLAPTAPFLIGARSGDDGSDAAGRAMFAEALADEMGVNGRPGAPKVGAACAATLQLPLGLCALGNRLYVADTHQHALVVYSLEGEHVATLGGEGSAPGRFRSPMDVAVVHGRLLVTEASRVQVLSTDGRPCQVIELPGAQQLTGVAVDVRGTHVYVCDSGSSQVHVLRVHGAP